MKESIIIVFVAILIVGLIASAPIYAYGTRDTVMCSVSEKERVVTSESSKYLIFCEHIVLQNTDSLWYWKWDSSNVYGNLKVGEQYELDVYGLRIPFFSMYQNIIAIK